VLPRSAYDTEHLPGAICIPFDDFTPDALDSLERDRPTITYCYDYQCDLSARAAHRLETLGFSRVYDYTASKAAWLAAGLPAEGTVPNGARAGMIAHKDVPRCGLETTTGELAGLLGDGEPRAVVVDADNIVLGLVRREVLELPAATRIETVMQPAPPTVRPSITADELANSMADDGRSYVLVTHLDGTLIGAIERQDLYGHH
jgi:rhodanese-related sulfurtransferase